MYDEHESLKHSLNLLPFLGGGGGGSLWEDRMMAGFMPLKAELSVKDTFSIPEFSKLSTQVSENQPL